MSAEFWQEIERAEIRKIKHSSGEAVQTAIRAYCYTANRTWVLQVRDHLVLADGRRSQDFVVASAYLTKEDLYALQAGINRIVSEMELGEDPVLVFTRMSDAVLLEVRAQEERDAADAALAAVRDELARRSRDIALAHERERQRCQADATAVSALSSLIDQLVAVRDAAEAKLHPREDSALAEQIVSVDKTLTEKGGRT